MRDDERQHERPLHGCRSAGPSSRGPAPRRPGPPGANLADMYFLGYPAPLRTCGRQAVRRGSSRPDRPAGDKNYEAFDRKEVKPPVPTGRGGPTPELELEEEADKDGPAPPPGLGRTSRGSGHRAAPALSVFSPHLPRSGVEKGDHTVCHRPNGLRPRFFLIVKATVWRTGGLLAHSPASRSMRIPAVTCATPSPASPTAPPSRSVATPARSGP